MHEKRTFFGEHDVIYKHALRLSLRTENLHTRQYVLRVRETEAFAYVSLGWLEMAISTVSKYIRYVEYDSNNSNKMFSCFLLLLPKQMCLLVECILGLSFHIPASNLNVSHTDAHFPSMLKQFMSIRRKCIFNCQHGYRRITGKIGFHEWIRAIFLFGFIANKRRTSRNEYSFIGWCLPTLSPGSSFNDSRRLVKKNSYFPHEEKKLQREVVPSVTIKTRQLLQCKKQKCGKYPNQRGW